MTLTHVLAQVKKKLRPDMAIKDLGVRQAETLTYLLKKHALDATCTIGGSLAKETFLHNDHDVDMFVKFSKKYDSDKLADILEPIIKEFVEPYERVHGSRDYFQFTKKHLLNGNRGKQVVVMYEVIPVYAIASAADIANVTDASPLHVTWAYGRIKKGKLGDEIRLAKQFLKAHGLYGAESYISGFSGHIVDILIIHYGSFLKLLKAAALWQERVIIDVEGHLKDPLHELNGAKVYSPLIIVDPVQKDRNAAAAVSEEKFELFKEAAREFLKKPSAAAFVIQAPTLEEGKRHAIGNHFFGFHIVPLAGKKDVVGAKLLQVFEYIKRQLAEHDFPVVQGAWSFDMMYFIVGKTHLSKTIVHEGPPLHATEGVDRFREKHPDARVKGKRLVVDLPRQYARADDLLHDILTSAYVKERVKKIERAKTMERVP